MKTTRYYAKRQLLQYGTLQQGLRYWDARLREPKKRGAMNSKKGA